MWGPSGEEDEGAPILNHPSVRKASGFRVRLSLAHEPIKNVFLLRKSPSTEERRKSAASRNYATPRSQRMPIYSSRADRAGPSVYWAVATASISNAARRMAVGADGSCVRYPHPPAHSAAAGVSTRHFGYYSYLIWYLVLHTLTLDK